MLHAIVREVVRVNDLPGGAIGDVRDALGREHASLLAAVLDYDEQPRDLDRRALELAKAHHAAMGPAMREHMPGQSDTMVANWIAMPKPRRDTMVAVMRKLLNDGTIT